MIITNQVKQLLGPFWTLYEISSNHVKFTLPKRQDYFIEIKKQLGRREYSPTISVTIPLEHVKFTTVFKNEMPAYEYIEDFIYDNMEKGVDFGEHLIERKRHQLQNYNNDIKRRRLSSTSCFHRMEPDWGWDSE